MPMPLTSILKSTCTQNSWAQAFNFITMKLLIMHVFNCIVPKDLVLQTQPHPLLPCTLT